LESSRGALSDGTWTITGSFFYSTIFGEKCIFKVFLKKTVNQGMDINQAITEDHRSWNVGVI
jgi:hypothetical protein